MDVTINFDDYVGIIIKKEKSSFQHTKIKNI